MKLGSGVEAHAAARSDIAALALARFFAEYERGAVDLESMKMPARSLKFAFRLDLPGN